MAEAFLNSLGGGRFMASSAGLEPGTLNPLAVEVMEEVGIDISQNPTKGVFDVYKSGALFGYVITVCDKEAAQRCPSFPGIARTLVWSFPDPASFTGTWEKRLAKTREVLYAIKTRIEKFIKDEEEGNRPDLDFAVKPDKVK